MRTVRDKLDIEETVEQFSDMIFKIAFSYTTCKETSEDIMQNVLIKYMTCEKDFQNIEHKKAWIIRVTINECKKHFRFLHYESEKEKKSSMEHNVSDEKDVYYAVVNLPKKYRIVIHLYYYEQLSVKEISEVLQMKENTIMSLLHRARQRLRKIMEVEYEY